MAQSIFYSSAMGSLSGMWRAPTIALATWLLCSFSQASGGNPDTAVSQQPGARKFEPVVQVGHPGRVRDVLFSPDAKYFVTTAHGPSGIGDGPGVILWDATSGEKLRSFPVDTHGLAAHFCLDGTAIVLGRQVCDIQTGEARCEILGEDEIPIDVKVSADTQHGIVGTRAGRVLVTELTTGQTAASFAVSDLNQGATECAAEAGYRLLAVGMRAENLPLALLANDRLQIAVCNVADAKILAEFQADTFDAARFSPDARYVLLRRWEDTGSPMERSVIYDADSGKKLVSSDEWIQDANSVKFTADGRFCVTGSANLHATLWDLATGQPVHRFDHKDPILAMRLLDDDAVLETQSMDLAKRWDIDSGKLLKEFAPPETQRASNDGNSWQRKAQSLSAVAPRVVPSLDGKTFLWSGRVFEAETNKVVCELAVPALDWKRQPAYQNLVERVTYVPGGRMAIVSYRTSNNDANQTVLFDLTTGAAVRQLASSVILRNGLQWSRDGRRALTFSHGLHRLWDVEHGRLLQTIGVGPIERGGVKFYRSPSQIAFSENGKFVYTGGTNSGAFFWDAETGEPLHHDPPGQQPPNQKGWIDAREHDRYYSGRSIQSPSRRYVASRYSHKNDRQHSIEIWDVERAELFRTLDHGALTPTTPFFSPDERYLAVACARDDQAVVMWDLDAGRKLYALQAERITHHYSLPSVDFVPQSRNMLVNSGQRDLTLHCVETGMLIHRMTDTQPAIGAKDPERLREELLLSPDGRYVVADYGVKYSIVWNVATGKRTQLIERDTGSVPVSRRLQFSDDGRRLLTRMPPAKIWHLESGEVTELGERERLAEIEGFGAARGAARARLNELSPAVEDALQRFESRLPASFITAEKTADDRRLIVYEHDGCMVVWDIASAKEIYRCYQFNDGGRWLTISPNGKCYGDLELVRYRKVGTLDLVKPGGDSEFRAR